MTFFWLTITESDVLEEDSHPLQLLLHPKDHRPYRLLPLLLHCPPRDGWSSPSGLPSTSLRSITCLHVFSNPRSNHLLVFWLLFETGRVNEWVVTDKLGDALKTKLASKPKKLCFRIWQRLHLLELFKGVYLFCCVYYDFVHGRRRYFLYLTVQSMAFFITGVGYVGTFVPIS